MNCDKVLVSVGRKPSYGRVKIYQKLGVNKDSKGRIANKNFKPQCT